MSIISELEKLSFRNVFFYSFLVTAIISSGILFIFIFNQRLFFELDILKLLLLSMAITTPIYAFNCVIAMIGAEFNDNEGEEERFLLIMFIGIIITLIIISLLALIKLFVAINVKVVIVILLVLELGLFIWSGLDVIKRRNKHKKESKTI